MKLELPPIGEKLKRIAQIFGILRDPKVSSQANLAGSPSERVRAMRDSIRESTQRAQVGDPVSPDEYGPGNTI